MSVRLRRLSTDFERVRLLFQGDAAIRLVEYHGKPPEHYILEYHVNSIQQDMNSGSLRAQNIFRVAITLPGSYPRTGPHCRMITPVFHPNIAPHAICIGDHWAAGESLAGLIVRIAEMLAYQSYNIKSPLNGEAAQWAAKNRARLPLDRFDFSSLLTKGEVARKDEVLTTGACSNCGASGENVQLQACANGHVVCEHCILACARCGKALCMACSLEKCGICGELVCAQCRARCASCGAVACSKDAGRCRICREVTCRNCMVKCAACGAHVCVNHIHKQKQNGGVVYVCDTCFST